MSAEPDPAAPTPAPKPEDVPRPLRPRHFTPEQLLPIFGDPARYRILAVMLDGRAHSASELGRVVHRSREATSKHLATLRATGLVEPCTMRDDRCNGYRLVSDFVPIGGAARTLDFGWCLLRFGPW